ncbi:hypothetical protein RHMOL_Rhmol06G0111000 [Rhododendron molle]|uniref:Uncharacterized protein n=1 Tax=Rhododendron molle TaxID=49168 RepID=A0ACC0NB36_RHOML|nr:hypothetical protein RHMOL_Rhmol06G0111000 [Rhododendron molle]
MLMNPQNSITVMQQRAAQTDANITRLNELFDTRIPPSLEEESEAEEDVHVQPVMVESKQSRAPHCSAQPSDIGQTLPSA